jgi:endo-1,4-beta-xylanase
MKKTVGRVLALALAAAVFVSGCGSTKDTETPAVASGEGAQTESQKEKSMATNLKDAFADDFKVGVAVNPYQLQDEETASLIRENFNSITMENAMKPEGLLDQKASENSEDGMPEINTENLDSVLTLAKENGLSVRGHCLVWHSQTPEWFFCEDFDAGNEKVDKATMQKRMESYIKKVLTYCQENYPGVVYAWDVVNEACEDGGGYRTESNWYEIYGDESYIIDAFTYARKYAAADVKLFYNDYNEYTPAKMTTIAELLKTLADKKIIDGVGFQSHWDMSYPDVSMIEDAMEEYSKIDGLEIQFTEIDMHNTDDSEEDLQEQAERYQQIFEAITKADREGRANITSVTFWGLDDDVTWLTSFKGETSYPLLFDGEHNKKPCYDSILKVGNQE